MRQKKIKGVEKKMEVFSEPLVSDPAAYKGRWREAFRGYGRRVGRAGLSGNSGQSDTPRGDSWQTDTPSGDSLQSGMPHGGSRQSGALREDAPLCLEIGCGKGRFIKASALNDPGSLYLGFEGQKSVIYRALQRAYTDPDVRLRELNEIALALVGLCDDDGDGQTGRSGGDRAVRVGSSDGGDRAVRAGRSDDGDSNCDAELSADDDIQNKSGALTPDNLLLCAEYIIDMRDYFAEGELSGVFLNFSDPWPKTRQQKRRLTSPGYLDGYLHALKHGGFIRFKTDSADFFKYSRECLDAHPGFEITALTDDLHASEYAEDNEMTEYERRFLNLNVKIQYLEARKSARL